jgi:hypothetical protein
MSDKNKPKYDLFETIAAYRKMQGMEPSLELASDETEPLPPTKGRPTDTGEKADPSPLMGSISNVTKPAKLNEKPADVAPLTKPAGDELTEFEKAYLDTFKPENMPKRKESTLKSYDTAEERREAREALSRSQDIATYGDLATRIGNAIVRYAAANKGLKEGVDMSNIKTESPDFKQFLDQAAEQYKASLGDVDQKRLEREAEISKEEKRIQEQYRDDVGLLGEKRAGLKFQVDMAGLRKQEAAQAAEARAAATQRAIENARENEKLALSKKSQADGVKLDTRRLDQNEGEKIQKVLKEQIQQKIQKDIVTANLQTIYNKSEWNKLSDDGKTKLIMNTRDTLIEQGVAPTEAQSLLDAAVKGDGNRLANWLQGLASKFITGSEIPQPEEEFRKQAARAGIIIPDTSAETTVPSETPDEALEWARKNPGNPKSIEILKRKGLSQ